jgi:hypothetical protein
MPNNNALDPIGNTGYGLDVVAEVRCPACGSPAFGYPRELRDENRSNAPPAERSSRPMVK